MTEKNPPADPATPFDGAAALAAACDALRVARKTVRDATHAARLTGRSDEARENATRRDWSKACTEQLAAELERPDVDEAVVAAVRAVMFAPFPT